MKIKRKHKNAIQEFSLRIHEIEDSFALAITSDMLERLLTALDGEFEKVTDEPADFPWSVDDERLVFIVPNSNEEEWWRK